LHLKVLPAGPHRFWSQMSC